MATVAELRGAEGVGKVLVAGSLSVTGLVQLVYAPSQLPSQARYEDVTDNVPIR